MSNKQRKKHSTRGISSDSLAVRLLGGLLLMAFGLLLFLAVNLHMTGEMFAGLRVICYGLTGCLAFFLFLVPVTCGALLLLSIHRKPRLRTPLIGLLIYALLLAAIQLLTYTRLNGQSLPLMDYLARRASPMGSLQSMLSQAYTFSSEAGFGRAAGFLGMAFAWPLWQLLGAVPSGILCICGILACVFWIFRLHPVALYKGLRQRMTQVDPQKEARREAQAQEQLRFQQQQLAQRQAYEAQQAEMQSRLQNAPQRRTARTVNAGFQATPEERMAYPNPSPKKPLLAFSKIFGRQDTAQDAVVPPPSQNPPSDAPANPFMPSAASFTAPSAPAAEASWAYPADSLAAMQAQDPAQQTTSPVRASAPPVTSSSEKKPARRKADPPAEQPNPFEQAVERGDVVLEDVPASGQRTPTSWKSAVEEKITQLEDTERPALQQPKPSWTEGEDMQKPSQKVVGDVIMPVTTGPSVWDPALDIADSEEGETYGGEIIEKAPKPEPIPYVFPSLSFLKQPSPIAGISAEEDAIRAQLLEETLASFKIQAKVQNVTHGPAISRYELELAAGIKVSKITDLGPNIAMNMAVRSVRIEAPIPGKSLVGVEIPNPKVATVTLREVLESEPMVNSKEPLLVALGKDIAGSPIVCNLAKMPHLLIAGATGSGKSVCINTIINSLIYRCTPEEVRLIMVDPKVVELQCYNGIPHLLSPVVSDPHKAAGALQWAVDEMMKRYSTFTTAKVRNIIGYNESLGPDETPMPRIVIIIDELADLMMTCKKDVEESICRIAQLARAAGIHMVVATQRPSVDVITGLIKANIPSRIAFKVSSFTDSRTILDRNGAEQLLGYGDMLYQPMGEFTPTRVQGCFLSDGEVNQVADFVRAHSVPNYDPEVLEQLSKIENDSGIPAPDMAETVDDGTGDASLLAQCIEMAVNDRQVSTSLIQRRLKIGYARAGRLVDEMEKRGIVSAKDGAKPRLCLITREEYESMKSSGTLNDM